MVKKVEPIAVKPAEAARMLDMSRTTLYNLMRTPGFPVRRLGGCKRILVDELHEWVKQQADEEGIGPTKANDWRKTHEHDYDN